VKPEHHEPVILRGRHLLPMHGPGLDGGWLRIERGRIAAVGRGTPPSTGLDLGDVLVLPGLVNAHTHLEFSDLDIPLDPRDGLPAWIERVVTLRRSRGDDAVGEAARVRAAIAGGLAESAAGGVTTIGDIVTSPGHGLTKADPRVRMFHEGLGLSTAAASRTMARVEATLGPPGRSPSAQGISPHAPYSVAAPLGRRLLALAGRHRLPVAMHVAESRDEADLLASRSGRFRELLGSLGAWPAGAPPRLLSAAEWITLLASAPRGVVVHGTFLPEDPPAMARLARHRNRLCMAVCPRTTLALSGRLPPIAAFRAAGLRVAIGTDSRASSPDLSVLAECRTLTEAGIISPKEALHMATRSGAWALMLEHRCGLLAPGRPADLVILRPATCHGDPSAAALDPATQVIATMRSGRWIHGAVS
jgi:cytosine/adenosine deaminase-related metal-dependent hydrolase